MFISALATASACNGTGSPADIDGTQSTLLRRTPASIMPAGTGSSSSRRGWSLGTKRSTLTAAVCGAFSFLIIPAAAAWEIGTSPHALREQEKLNPQSRSRTLSPNPTGADARSDTPANVFVMFDSIGSITYEPFRRSTEFGTYPPPKFF